MPDYKPGVPYQPVKPGDSQYTSILRLIRGARRANLTDAARIPKVWTGNSASPPPGSTSSTPTTVETWTYRTTADRLDAGSGVVIDVTDLGNSSPSSLEFAYVVASTDRLEVEVNHARLGEVTDADFPYYTWATGDSVTLINQHLAGAVGDFPGSEVTVRRIR